MVGRDADAADSPPFAIRVLGTGQRAVRVVVSGELDLSSSPEFDAALTRAVADADEVLLDISGVTFIDSTGLSSILAAVSGSQLTGGDLRISSSLAPQARRLFELAGMDGTLPLVED
jgi:anti-anti-sigma factor